MPILLLLLGCSSRADPSRDAGEGTLEPVSNGKLEVPDLDGDGIPEEVPPGCGNGALTEDEACDDGNQEDGDGCAWHCLTVEPGFVCGQPGELCAAFARCGDSIVAGPEQCDDGGTTAGDGCSDNCQFEIGFKCSGEPSRCVEAECGDGQVEGAETCDDGNAVPFDGCDANCQAEPACDALGCTSTCGDGIMLGDEVCDDGNTIPGDGCSDACEVEEGYDCSQAPCSEVGGNCVLRVPAVYRDFTASHMDFAIGCGTQTNGVVAAALGANRKPVLARSENADVCIASDESFAEWYTEVRGTNATLVGELVLFERTDGSYVNRYGENGEQYDGFDGNPLFFPLEGADEALEDERFVATIPEEVYGGGWLEDPSGKERNFHFTSEIAYWFQYDAGTDAALTFTGDDDVWVFVNGFLALDLGGPHVPMTADVEVSSATASDYSLVDGRVYEIRVFHAERRETGSSFQLTLSGFDVSRSKCTAHCGDGVVGLGEECDDEVNDGGYNECQPGCALGSYCGDGELDDGEDCDDGNRIDDDDCPNSCRRVIIR